jgi:hypothetical protein
LLAWTLRAYVPGGFLRGWSRLGFGLLGGFELAHGRPVQFQAIGVVDDAIEDGVGERRVADDLVPLVVRQLAGNERRAAAIEGWRTGPYFICGRSPIRNSAMVRMHAQIWKKLYASILIFDRNVTQQSVPDLVVPQRIGDPAGEAANLRRRGVPNALRGQHAPDHLPRAQRPLSGPERAQGIPE